MWLGAAALAGATVVGINPTRRGAELARDISYTECQLIITDQTHLGLLDGLDLGVARDRVLVVGTPEYDGLLVSNRRENAALSFTPPSYADDAQFLLLFTSGTSGAPKAVITSHRRLHFVATSIR